ncbi:S8 family serine peptidase [Candidatus Micrarchaeota archaeon]|nr:S8 family serine peptidase [Candidatus Micrarchaeota archaeon]
MPVQDGYAKLLVQDISYPASNQFAIAGSSQLRPADAPPSAFSSGSVQVQRKFGNGNFYAIRVKAPDAERLKADPALRVWEERKFSPLLDVSTPLIAPQPFWNSGLNASGVRVCVIDTGVNKLHPALAGRVVAEKDLATGDSAGNDPSDFSGHGTHVAGIVASSDSTLRALGFGASLLNAKVFDSVTNLAAESDIMAAVDWCIAQNASVLTLSLGAPDAAGDGSDALSQYLDLAVDAGKVVTVSAGNSGPGGDSNCRNPLDSAGASYSACSPGLARKAITVGSTQSGKLGTTADAISTFSSRGPTTDGRIKPDLTAPGQPITSAWKDGGFATASGTSMAAPQVASLSSLLLQLRPSISPAELKALLSNSAVHLGTAGKNGVYGAGRINASRAFYESNFTLLANVSNSTSYAHVIAVSNSTPEIRATLYWPESYPLHNGLSLSLLNPAGDAVAVSSGVNDSTQSVTLPNPSPAGNWRLVVSGLNVSGIQKYALASDVNASSQMLLVLGSIGGINSTAFHWINSTSAGANLSLLLDWNDSNSTLALYIYSLNGSAINSSIASGRNSQSITSALGPAGTYLLGIVPLSLGGLQSLNYSISSSLPISSRFSDTLPPVVSISSPGNFSYANGNLALSFTAIDGLAKILNCSYALDSSANLLSSNVTNSTPYSLNFSAGAGAHSVSVSCTDLASNTGNSRAAYFYVSSLLPFNVSIYAPPNSSYFNSSNSTLAASSSRTALWLNYSIDGSAVQVACTLCSSFTQTVSLSQGWHNFTAFGSSAYDAVSSNASASFFIDSILPAIDSTSPQNNSATSSSVAQFNVSYSESNVASVVFSYWLNSSVAFNSSVSNCLSGNSSCGITLNLTAFPDGPLYYNFSVVDIAGNAAQSNDSAMIIDRAPPSLISTWVSPSLPAFGDAVVLHSNWTELTSSISSVVLQSDFTGVLANYSSQLQSGVYSHSIPAGALRAGSAVRWMFFANDSAGNSNSSPSNSFTVSKATPSAALLFNGGSQTQFTSGDSISVSSFSNSSINITVYDNFSGSFSARASGLGFANYALGTSGFAGAINVTAFFEGNENFTNSSISTILFVSPQSGGGSNGGGSSGSPSGGGGGSSGSSGGGGGGSSSGGASSGGGSSSGSGSSSGGSSGGSGSSGSGSSGSSSGGGGSGGGVGSSDSWLEISGIPQSISAEGGGEVVLSGILRNSVPGVLQDVKIGVDGISAQSVAVAPVGLLGGFGQAPIKISVKLPSNASGNLTLSLRASASVIGTAYTARSRPVAITIAFKSAKAAGARAPKATPAPSAPQDAQNSRVKKAPSVSPTLPPSPQHGAAPAALPNLLTGASFVSQTGLISAAALSILALGIPLFLRGRNSGHQ